MPKKPNERQLKFAEGKLAGLSDVAAAEAAGYSTTNTTRIDRTPLREAQAALSASMNLTKSDVLEGIVGAIQRAQTLGEPSTEIRGWEAVAKMLGFNAPEVRKVDISIDQSRLRQKFEQLSDEELLQIAQKPLIEGSCERIN